MCIRDSAHEILLCVQTGKMMSDPNRMHWNSPDFYLKSRDEMMELFGELEDCLLYTSRCV